MRTLFGKKRPSSPEISIVRDQSQSNFLHDFYEFHLKDVMLAEAAKHGSPPGERPAPEKMGKSRHLYYISRFCCSRASMDGIGLIDSFVQHTKDQATLPDTHRAAMMEHVRRRAEGYGKGLARAATSGIRYLHPYMATYDTRFHDNRVGTQTAIPVLPGGDTASPCGATGRPWQLTEWEWNYAMTAMWALRRGWNLPFFPDDAFTRDPAFGREMSEAGEILIARRKVCGTERFKFAERDIRTRSNPHKFLSPFRVRAAVNHGDRMAVTNPDGTFSIFDAAEPRTRDLESLALQDVFSHGAIGSPRVFFCECTFVHRTNGEEKIALVAFDLESATFFDPEVGEFEQTDGDSMRLRLFIFRTWIPAFHEDWRLLQVALFPRAPRSS